MLNVRAIDAIDSRERGGSRPGLMLSHIDNLGGPVLMLSPMTLALGDGFTNFSDTFDGDVLSSAWEVAVWATDMPKILSSIPAAAIDTTVASGAAVMTDDLEIDTDNSYTVEMLVVPWAGSFCGSYRLYLRLNDDNPNIDIEGVVVELLANDSAGTYTGTLTSMFGSAVTSVVAFDAGAPGTPSPAWLSATVTAPNTVTVYWNGEQVATGTMHAHTGKKIGFGLDCTVDGGLSLANVLRVQYYSTTTVNQLRTMLVASAGGYVFYESSYGRMSTLETDLTLQSNVPLLSAQDGQELYIADYGDVIATGIDGTLAGTVLTTTAASGWTEGIADYDMVVVISDSQGTAKDGTYEIDDFDATSITLSSNAGSGACSYRVERAPKIYDPLLNTLSIWTAVLSGNIANQVTPGQVPTGCPCVCRYKDRLVLAGAEIAPHVWYMARQGDPLDWDYTQSDAQAAVAGTASPAGVPGEPITALVPHSDDYLIIGCTNSLWRMMGDPASGGTLGCLSHAIGILGSKAWCLMPDGMLVFLSHDGLYSLDAGGNSFPIPMSRENLPREFVNLNADTVIASLEYDLQAKGVHIFLTSKFSNERTHWWLDNAPETSLAMGVSQTIDRKAFWPLTLISDHEPTATCVLNATTIEDSCVILGGRDGSLRRFYDLAEDDCGTEFTSYVLMGPIALGDDVAVGTLMSIDAVMGEGGGDVICDLQPSLTFEGVISAESTFTADWIAGINATVYPACRGQAFVLVVAGTGRKWAIEQITGSIKAGGRRRIP